MLFNTFGNKDNPVIIMLPGSFCPAESMKNLYSVLCKDFYIIAITYNGHHKDSKDFTSRQEEASEILRYIKECGISEIRMIYGQSMGAEIGIELLRQFVADGITVHKTFFDGAPCIKLSKAYKAFMLIKFKSLIKMVKNKSVDDVLKMSVVRKFAGGDAEALRPMLEDMSMVTPYLTDISIKNENECCYTFDFPQFDEGIQKNMFFFYGEEEKAYTLCAKYVRAAYPYAEYKVESGQGHLTYVSRHTEAYLELIKEWLI
ncbi:MAG: alpha/beta hydrolase [Ruminococcus sp.]|nr:alpha/beta hydrolase [Ruminococcus sp.]